MCNDRELNSITIKNGTPTCELMNGHLHPLLVSSYPKEVLVHIVPKDKRSECTNCSSLQKVIFKSLFSKFVVTERCFHCCVFKTSKTIYNSIYMI